MANEYSELSLLAGGGVLHSEIWRRYSKNSKQCYAKCCIAKYGEDTVKTIKTVNSKTVTVNGNPYSSSVPNPHRVFKNSSSIHCASMQCTVGWNYFFFKLFYSIKQGNEYIYSNSYHTIDFSHTTFSIIQSLQSFVISLKPHHETTTYRRNYLTNDSVPKRL